MKIITRTYTVRFLTPAFLGDAEQNGAWRTPPFKALLRQWWRVAYAAGRHTDADLVTQMRRDECLLFGVAADKDGDSRQSQVRIRLGKWDEGTLKSWEGLEQAAVYHPEVERTQHKVGPHAYLGYGPLDGRGGTKLSKPRAAIQFDDKAEFRLAWPESAGGIEQASLSAIPTALWLMDRYGALGGRSRNGWGSFSLTPSGDTPVHSGSLSSGLIRDWKDALKLDWPHAIGGAGGKPLIWETGSQSDWKIAMKRLAEIKIGLRTLFTLTLDASAGDMEIINRKTGAKKGIDHAVPQDRHWLSYPVTNHSVQAWGNNARLPNSLRFKVRQAADGKLRGVIFHVPCKPPPGFSPDRAAILAVWQRVHGLLDELCIPAVNRHYPIVDAHRLAALKPSLDTLALTRIPA